MKTLEELKDAFSKDLSGAITQADKLKSDVDKTQEELAWATTCSQALNDCNIGIATANELRKGVIASLVNTAGVFKEKNDNIVMAGAIFRKMEGDTQIWTAILNTQKDEIAESSTRNKEILGTAINETLKLYEEAKILWADLLKDLKRILGYLEATKGIPKMLEDQKKSIENDFDKVFTDPESTSITQEYETALAAFENAKKAQKDNDDKISQIKERLKNF